MQDRSLLAGTITRVAGIVAVVLLGASCASAPKSLGDHPTKGHLLIIGGALKEENAAVYKRFLQHAGEGAPVGVLPTASGVEDAGVSLAARISNYGTPGIAEVINVREANREVADTEEIAAQIRGKKGIFFTGGDQRRIVNAFRPGGKDTVGFKALLDVLANGGVIAGTSAGAAMMSDPIIGGGSSANALTRGVTRRDKEPHELEPTAEEVEPRGVLIENGMGFFPYGLTDQHFMARGRLGRTIIALESTGIQRGYGVDENSAIDVDLATGVIETVGNERALLLTDMGELKRDGDSRLGIRISMLGGGDRVQGKTGEITTAAGKKPLTPSASNTEPLPEPQEIWAKYVFTDLVQALALSPAKVAKGSDENFEVHLTKDDKTRVLIGPAGDPKTISVINLRMDIVPKKSGT